MGGPGVRGGHTGASRRPRGPAWLAVALLAIAAACGGGGGDGDAAGPGGEARPAGRELFLSGTSPSCASCHRLEDAGARGTIGPSLDRARPSAEEVREAITSGPGVMPVFSDQLDDDQVDALAGYVAEAAGAG